MSEEEIRELLDEILSGNLVFVLIPIPIHIKAGDAEFAGGYRGTASQSASLISKKSDMKIWHVFDSH